MLFSKCIHTHPQLQACTSLSFTCVCEYFTSAAHLIRLHFTGDARCVCVCVCACARACVRAWYTPFWVSGGLGSLISHRQKNIKKARVRSADWAQSSWCQPRGQCLCAVVCQCDWVRLSMSAGCDTVQQCVSMLRWTVKIMRNGQQR